MAFSPLSIRWCWLAFLLAGVASLRAQNPNAAAVQAPAISTGAAAPRVLRDLAYVTGGSPRQRLNLFLPPTPRDGAKVPLIVNIHGGGWQAGNKEQTTPGPLLDHGYALASIDYRLSQDAIYPAQIEDCKAAIRWLRAHAAEYGYDPTRIGVKGESSGAHLAALLGTTGQTRQFDVGENLDQSSAVTCVFDRFGPSDLQHWESGPEQKIRLDKPDSYISKLLGGLERDHEALARAASPLDFVDQHSAPFLIFHGNKDTTVPLSQSQLLDAALKKAGVESTLIIVPGAGHNGPPFSNPHLAQLMFEFFDRHLK